MKSICNCNNCVSYCIKIIRKVILLCSNVLDRLTGRSLVNIFLCNFSMTLYQMANDLVYQIHFGCNDNLFCFHNFISQRRMCSFPLELTLTNHASCFTREKSVSVSLKQLNSLGCAAMREYIFSPSQRVYLFLRRCNFAVHCFPE